MAQRCSNPAKPHGGSWYATPDFQALYVRETIPSKRYGEPGKRKWVRVGSYCAECKYVLLDESGGEE